MSKSASLFRKNDVKRAFEAAASAGVKVSVEIDRAGKLKLVPLDDETGKSDPEIKAEIIL